VELAALSPAPMLADISRPVISSFLCGSSARPERLSLQHSCQP
jgi:hypothetical protein